MNTFKHLSTIFKHLNILEQAVFVLILLIMFPFLLGLALLLFVMLIPIVIFVLPFSITLKVLMKNAYTRMQQKLTQS